MALPVPFGFSAGDVIAVSILVKDLYKALDDSTGASAEYQQLSRELWSLDRTLLEVELLSRTCDTSIELNALGHTTRRIVDQCRESIESFLQKIRGYNGSLREGGSDNRFRDVRKKIKWVLTQKEEIAKFRTEINGHSSTINMLLITASINVTKLTERSLDTRLIDAQRKGDAIQYQQSASLARVHEKLDDNARNLQDQGTNTSRLAERMDYFFKLGAELKTFMFKIWTLNFKTYNAVLDLQTRIPQEFKPCWIQEPLILTDPLGRIAPIHLELINSWEVFETVLVARFNRLPGQGKITRREYAITEANLKFDIDRTQSFESSFIPGRRLDMSMVFKRHDELMGTSCPSCRQKSSEASSIQVKCSRCGIWYQRIVDINESSNTPQNGFYSPPSSRSTKSATKRTRDHKAASLQQAPLLRKRKLPGTAHDEDDIRAFRRVRLLLPRQKHENHLGVKGPFQRENPGSSGNSKLSKPELYSILCEALKTSKESAFEIASMLVQPTGARADRMKPSWEQCLLPAGRTLTQCRHSFKTLAKMCRAQWLHYRTPLHPGNVTLGARDLTEQELKFVLGEALKSFPEPYPRHLLVDIVMNASPQPSWNSMRLPPGRSLAACKYAFEQLRETWEGSTASAFEQDPSDDEERSGDELQRLRDQQISNAAATPLMPAGGTHSDLSYYLSVYELDTMGSDPSQDSLGDPFNSLGDPFTPSEYSSSPTRSPSPDTSLLHYYGKDLKT